MSRSANPTIEKIAHHRIVRIKTIMRVIRETRFPRYLCRSAAMGLAVKAIPSSQVQRRNYVVNASNASSVVIEIAGFKVR